MFDEMPTFASDVKVRIAMVPLVASALVTRTVVRIHASAIWPTDHASRLVRVAAGLVAHRPIQHDRHGAPAPETDEIRNAELELFLVDQEGKTAGAKALRGGVVLHAAEQGVEPLHPHRDGGLAAAAAGAGAVRDAVVVGAQRDAAAREVHERGAVEER